VTSAEIEIGTVNADGSDGEEGSRSKEEQDDTGEDVADGDVNVEVGMMDHMTVFGFEPFDGPTVAFILLCVFVRLFVGYLVCLFACLIFCLFVSLTRLVLMAKL
jgi:hypothetical protein